MAGALAPAAAPVIVNAAPAAGVVQIEDHAVYLRHDQVTNEDNPNGMTVRYYPGAMAVLWRRVLGARLRLVRGQHRIEFSRHPGRIQLPFGLRQP